MYILSVGYSLLLLVNTVTLCMVDAASENDVYSTLIEAIPKILNWLRYFRAAEVL